MKRVDEKGYRTEFGKFADRTEASVSLNKMAIEMLEKKVEAVLNFLEIEVMDYPAVKKRVVGKDG